MKLADLAKHVNRRGKRRKASRGRFPSQYERQLRTLIRKILDKYQRMVNAELYNIFEQIQNTPEFKADEDIGDISTLLKRLSSSIANLSDVIKPELFAIGLSIAQKNQANYTRMIDSTLGVDLFLHEPWLDDFVQSWALQNADFITSIPAELHGDVSRLTYEALRQGVPVDELQRDIAKQFNLSQGRAKTIARTETAKLYSQIDKKRAMEDDRDWYYWSTSADERVRESHKVLNNKLCDYRDPTIYSDDNGKTWKKRSNIGAFEGDVGEDFNCRCVALVYVEDILEEVEDE